MYGTVYGTTLVCRLVDFDQWFLNENSYCFPTPKILVFFRRIFCEQMSKITVVRVSSADPSFHKKPFADNRTAAFVAFVAFSPPGRPYPTLSLAL
jgi:hypothetical protein